MLRSGFVYVPPAAAPAIALRAGARVGRRRLPPPPALVVWGIFAKRQMLPIRGGSNTPQAVFKSP
jgi:hypothetical protein